MSTTLSIVSDALDVFREFTGESDVQVQTIQVFLKVVLSGGGTVSYSELEKMVGVSQSAVSRSIQKMVTGPRATPGYGLITIDFDPMDLRRRVIQLSPRGRELVAAMEARMLPSLLRYLARQGVPA